MSRIENEYNEGYFSWQRTVGEFGGRANLFKFKKYIQKSDKVLDLGCGGGYLLGNLDCLLRVGIDINPSIKEPQGVRIFSNSEKVLEEFGAEFFDVVISNHALEHIENPAEALRSCNRLLKPGGKIVVVVPSETHRVRFRIGDINNHIFTFAPMNLGNLLTLTGFEVLAVKRIFHKWPPKYRTISDINFHLFHFLSYIYGHLKWNSIQLIAYARKNDSL